MEYRQDSAAFENLLLKFREDYAKQSETYQKRMEDVVRFLSDETDGLKGDGIRHPPISSRLKTTRSAVNSIRRRQKERIDRRNLRQLVQKRGEEWGDYCKRWGEANKVDETEPFETLEQVYAAVQDLAGVRVSVYLPGDVSRVKDFLEKRTRMLVPVRTHHKTDHDPRVPSLQGRIDDEERNTEAMKQNDLDRDHNTSADGGVLEAPRVRTVFAGYSAYHIIVKVSRDHIRNRVDSDDRPGENILIEVQVATAVMHAWQGVEHDIVYKNLDSEPPSDDEVRLIDLFNGIILTGQVALEQLEATTRKRDIARVSHSKEPVQFPWELEAIIAKHYKDCDRPIPNNAQWSELSRLLGALAAADHQAAGKVKGLLGEVEKDREVDKSTFDPYVPLRMLEVLCKIQTLTIEDPGRSKVGSMFAEARFYALRLVHTLNMAIYFNIARDLILALRSREDYPESKKRPFPADFLDILHPQCTSSNLRKHSRIISFCKWLLNYTSHFKSRDSASYDMEARIRLDGNLPGKALVVWPKPLEGTKAEMNPQNGAIMVPTWLLTLLRLGESESAGETRKKTPGNTDTVWRWQPDPSGSAILEQLQAFFVPRLDPDMDPHEEDQESAGLWSIARGESLSPWEIRKIDFTDATPGFMTGTFETPTTKNSFGDLADRLSMETTVLYQLVHEVRESVLVGNKKSDKKEQPTGEVHFLETDTEMPVRSEVSRISVTDSWRKSGRFRSLHK